MDKMYQYPVLFLKCWPTNVSFFKIDRIAKNYLPVLFTYSRNPCFCFYYFFIYRRDCLDVELILIKNQFLFYVIFIYCLSQPAKIKKKLMRACMLREQRAAVRRRWHRQDSKKLSLRCDTDLLFNKLKIK